MLPSGAHVKIGAHEFYLDESVDHGSTGGGLYTPHYRYSEENMFSETAPVAGSKNTMNLRPGRLLWFINDFSGGEGYKFFHEDDPSVYASSNSTNTRLPGQITGRPQRFFDSTSITCRATADSVRVAIASGVPWVGGGYSLAFGDGGVGWTNVDTSATTASDYVGLRSLSTSYRITAMSGDEGYCYYAAFRAGPFRTIFGKKKDQNTNLGVSLTATVETAKSAYAGLALMNNTLFCWTGVTLSYFSTGAWDGATALTENYVYGQTNTILSTLTLGTDYYAGICAGENAVYMFFARQGHSYVYQCSLQSDGTYAFTPIWTPPLGLTINSISYQNGVVMVAGAYNGGNINGPGEIWAIPLDNLRPILLTNPRWHTGGYFTPSLLSSSQGETTLMALNNGLAIYDAQADSFTNFDDYGTYTSLQTDAFSVISGTFNGYSIAATFTYGGNRWAIFNHSAGTETVYPAMAYYNDDPAYRQAGTATNSMQWVWSSPVFDNNLPFQQKTLMGIHLMFEPLVAGQTIKINWAPDPGTVSVAQDSGFPSTYSISSGHADALKGRTFIDLSGATQTTYTNLSVSLLGVGTNGVMPPVVTGIAMESALIAYEKSWRLILRLKNPTASQRGSKDSTMVSASVARDYIRATVDAGAAVTFLDGYRYKTKGGLGVGYSSHVVTIEDPADTIIGNAEGSMHVVLRSVPA